MPAEPLLVPDVFDGDVATLDEAESKSRLASFGVPRPRGIIARSEEAAVEAAAALGGPVAVKALGIAHKTERHAVHLALNDPCAVRASAADLLGRAGAVLVEEFVADTLVELIVGVSRDPAAWSSVDHWFGRNVRRAVRGHRHAAAANA